VRAGRLDGITCVIDGRLYDPSTLARELGIDVGDGPELVIRAYQRLGASFASRLRGRFALAIWDSQADLGFLTCDPLATRPLFVWRGTSQLAFATELNELLAILPRRPGPDPVGFPMWLAGGTCPHGHTLYEGVSCLGPGELIELQMGSVRTQEYWRPRYAGTMAGTRAELALGLRDELHRSTGRRLSPRASGVVLSGGLDSSIVTAVASRVNPPGARLRSYSAVFPGSEYDETWKIQDLTRHIGVDPAAIQLQPQGTLWLALHHTKQWQMPLMGAGALIDMMAVAEAAGDGAETVLDGQTGDEVLGFSPYALADRLRHGRLVAAMRLVNNWPMGRATNRREKLWMLKNCGLKAAVPYRLGRFVRDHRDRGPLGPPWLLPAVRSLYGEMEDMWAWKSGASGPRWWRYLADLLIQAPHRELRLDYLRHRASGFGVVNESPLYDLDLIDYCLKVPPELGFEYRFTRPLAREAVRGIVPDSVRLQGQKAIFSSFCLEALTGADSPGIELLLTAHDAELGAYADLEHIRRLWHQERPSPGVSSTSWGTAVWRLAAAEAWLRSQSDPGFLDEMLARPDVPAPSLARVDIAANRTFFPLVEATSSA
jgi:asparagine synthase (glutamine-hydrolysing)